MIFLVVDQLPQSSIWLLVLFSSDGDLEKVLPHFFHPYFWRLQFILWLLWRRQNSQFFMGVGGWGEEVAMVKSDGKLCGGNCWLFQGKQLCRQQWRRAIIKSQLLQSTSHQWLQEKSSQGTASHYIFKNTRAEMITHESYSSSSSELLSVSSMLLRYFWKSGKTL